MQTIKTSETIRTLRKNKNITQEQLAEILGISSAAISKWESGITYPDIQLLPVLARYFHVSIDFLMGFSNTISQDEREKIYTEVSSAFQSFPFIEAVGIWEYYVRQYPADYDMKYNLANISLLQLHKASSTEEDMISFTTRLIDVYKQCTASDNLKIKQGSYYQIGNLHIALQDYESAQKALARIPVQEASPQLLLNMMLVNKGEYSKAIKNIQESILRAINEIIGELGHLINVQQKKNNSDTALNLHYMQCKLLDLFELTPLTGKGVILQIALLLSAMGKYDDSLLELENLTELLEHYSARKVISDIPFFSEIETHSSLSVQDGMNTACKMMLDNIFSQIKDSERSQKIKRRLYPFFE